jgi:molybdenum cofactor guanylyltransferase
MRVFYEQTLGVLLAGGRSLRMGGGDKCLAPLAGRPLLAHAIERLRPQVKFLVVNANGDRTRFDDFGLPVVSDTMAEFPGPLAGILAGMAWARSWKPGIRHIVTTPTDAPFFPTDLVERLSTGIAGDVDIAIASCRNRDHPVFGLFPVALADALAKFLQESANRAVHAWLDSQKVVRVDFTPKAELVTDPFFNINSPSDLATAERLIERPDERMPMR